MPTVPTAVETPFFAYAGVIDLTVEKVREQAATLPATAAAFPAQARAIVQSVQLPTVEQLKERVQVPSVEALRDLVQFPDVATLKALPTELQATLIKRYAELTEDIKSLRGKATTVYGELATRGEKAVAGLRGEVVAEEKKVEKTVKSAAKKAPAKAKAAAAKVEADVAKVETTVEAELAGEPTLPTQGESQLG